MPSPLLRRPAAASYFLPLLLIFQSLPPPEKIIPPPFKKEGGGGEGEGANYETGCTFDVFDVVELKSKHPSGLFCKCNISLSVCPVAKASFPFWSENKEWMHSDYLCLLQVCCPHPSFLLKTGWSRIGLFFTDFFWMTLFFNIDSTSFVTNKDTCADIFGWCGTFSWNVSKMKPIFRLETHY